MQPYDLIGDIHGQANELVKLLKKMSYVKNDGIWQHQSRKVIFLGDFVDRGSGGVEVFCTLLAFHFLCPGSVYFNRGNHEARAQTSWMGFEQEVLEKYCKRSDTTAGRKLYNLFIYKLCDLSLSC